MELSEERERDPIGSRDLDAGYEQAWRSEMEAPVHTVPASAVIL